MSETGKREVANKLIRGESKPESTQESSANTQCSPTLTIHDRTGRRQFIRQGAAMLVVGSTLASSKESFADDCDQYRGQEKDTQAEGSDSDKGEGADPTGCGRQPSPKISRHNTHDKRQLKTVSAPAIAKIKS